MATDIDSTIRGWDESVVANVDIKNFVKDFGSDNNLTPNVNDTVDFDNTFGYSSIGIRVRPPTGGTVIFEGSFDGTNYSAITVRAIDADIITQTANAEDDYLGSIAALRKFRVRVISAGSGNGKVMGRAGRDVSVLEGVEFGAPPHKTGYNPVRKDAEYTAQATAQSIWVPATGKRFVVTDYMISARGNTDGLLTIFDENNSSGNYLFKGQISPSNSLADNIPISLSTPFVSSSPNNRLMVTTSDAITLVITIKGYEI